MTIEILGLAIVIMLVLGSYLFSTEPEESTCSIDDLYSEELEGMISDPECPQDTIENEITRLRMKNGS